jgi:hypothetical protein
MKQKDIALIVVIAAVAGVFSLILSQIFLASPDDLQQDVEVVQQIDASFPDLTNAEQKQQFEPFFNEQAVNPTSLIRITENKNENPFE